jgi:adenylate cyclase
MGTEIERKFLIKDDRWRLQASGGVRYRQGYLSTDRQRSVRVRVAGEAGSLTIKGETRGIRRSEFEYAIPLEDAIAMLDEVCLRPLIEKVRYRVQTGGRLWEVDEFLGANAGLLVAEVELAGEDEALELPEWVGEEVSADARYFNVNLVAAPFSEW